MKKRLLLIDANSIIHRAFHALPPLTSKKREPIGAVYGAVSAFLRIFSNFRPQYVVVAFDFPGKTFRHKKYKDYKAHRPKTPEELVSQIEKSKDFFHECGIAVLEKEGWEGDDVIGTISFFSSKDMETIIASGDKDILQLANTNTKVYNLKKGIKGSVLYTENMVKEDYNGISPENIPDIKALQGDPSDNIPGVSGIGRKTAIKLIGKFKNLESLYSSLDDIDSKKLREKLIKEREKAFMSKELGTIKRDKSFSFNFSDYYFDYKKKNISSVLEKFGFHSLISRLPEEKERVNLKLKI